MTPEEKTLREVIAKAERDPLCWDQARRRSLIAHGPALLAALDEARRELVGLREASIEMMSAFPHPTDDPIATARGIAAEAAWERARDGTSADIATQVRTRHRAEALREAATTLEKPGFEVGFPPVTAIARWLLARAEEEETR